MKDYLNQLDPGQHQAVTSKTSNILCLAGAGSGKTRVLTTRVFYLVKKLGVDPENILAITFTKNAAFEMKARLGRMGVDVSSMWCRTFHSMCYKILVESGLNQKLNIINEAEQEKLLKQIIESLCRNKDLGYKLHRFLEENNWPMYLFREQVFKIIKTCKNHTISQKSLLRRFREIEDEDIKEFYRLFYIIYNAYREYLRSNKLYDFSDLINLVIKKFRRDKKALKKYQARFKYILVDEFQDVDIGQVRLLKLLRGKSNNLFAVGDDWQSIYGFRRGDVGFILNFDKTFSGSVEMIMLPYNYRSDGYIVDAASRVIRKNKYQQRKKIKSYHKAKVKIKTFYGQSIENCQNFVIGAIKKLMSNNVRPSKIMILGRNWKNLDWYIKKSEELGWDDISITTIHGAKGMERAIVFLVGLHKGRGGFPNVKEDDDIMSVVSDGNIVSRLEEERRCFYVGITRAKRLLFLITEKDNESEFVRDVSRKYCEKIIAKPKQKTPKK